MSEKKISFEDAMKRLDEIVKSLEKGDAPLDDSLKLFEEGTHMISICSDMLTKAEQKVLKLSKGPDGEPIGEDFSSEVQ
mgnify:FL=1